MRTIVDLREEQILELSEICARIKISRAEAIRKAIDWFAKSVLPQVSGQEAFGIWKDRRLDSLEYIDQLRNEWDSYESSL
ncbi:MAG: hypothetical protein WCK49_02980 [Myxococcaceae bacterium]